MNTNQLYFDGSLGQFIRKANYEQVSVNPTLEVQHGMSSLSSSLSVQDLRETSGLISPMPLLFLSTSPRQAPLHGRFS